MKACRKHFLYQAACLGAVLLLLCFVLPVLAAESPPPPQPSLISLTLNGKMAVDMEILQWPDGSFSIPLKHTANLLDIPTQQSHESHAVTFTDSITSAPVRIDASKQMITRGEEVFDHLPHPIVYVASGLFSQEELYVPQALAEQFLGVKLALESTTQSVTLSTNRPIKILLRITEAAEPDSSENAEASPDTAPQEPDQTGSLLETVTLDFNSTTYQEVQASQTQYLNAGSSLSTLLKGYLAGMPYSIGPRIAYQNGQFGILELKGKIQREGKNTLIEAGVLNTGLSPLITPNIPLWGLQIASNNATQPILSPNNRQVFEGLAPGSGSITLTLNGSPYALQKPKEQSYRFEEVPLQPNVLNRIQITQQNPDGSQTILLEKSLPYYPQTLHAGEKAYSAFLGRAPFQFQPPGFSEEPSLLLPQSNKWVVGGRYYRGLTEKLTLGVAAAADAIFGSAQTSALGQLLNSIQIPDLTGFLGYRRDPNLMSGASLGVSLIYRPASRWTVSADMGIGQQNSLELQPAGQLSLLYQGPANQTSVKLFHYGANYYTPVTLGENNLYDRQGLSLQTSGQWKGLTYQLGADHALANLAQTIAEGGIVINRLNGSLYRRLTKKTDGRFAFSFLEGQNEARTLNIQNTQLEVNRMLPWDMRLRLALRRSNNRYLFNPTNPLQLLPVQTQTQLSQFVEAGLQFPLPRQAGTMQIGGNFSQALGLVNLQGSLQWHRFTLEPTVQSSVFGDQSLLTIGMGLFYEWVSGRRVGLRYAYNVSSLPLVSTALGQNQRVSQQFQVDLNDTLALLAGHLTSLGNRSDSTGIVKGKVFLDLNKNGKQDVGEPGAKDIPLLIDGKHPMKSDTKGRFYIAQLPPGLHKVSYNLDQLPINLSPTTPPVTVNIAAGKATSVAFGLIVTPGTLSGQVQLHDVQGKALNPTDTVVVLKDAQGKEVQFTYTDGQGHYSLSDVPPGSYHLSLETKQVNERHLKVLTPAYAITVPVEYETFYDRKGLDFDVIQLMQGSRGE